MRLRALVIASLVLVLPICALARVGLGNLHQQLMIAGDIETGIYIDGPVGEVRAYLGYMLENRALSERRVEFILSLLDQLYELDDGESVLVQPLGAKPSYDDYLYLDTYVDQASADSNYGTSGELLVGCHESWWTDYEQRGLWGHYDCPSGTVNSATLKVWIKDNRLDTDRAFIVGRPTSPWDEYSVTWNNQPGITDTNSTTFPAGHDHQNMYGSFTATSAVTAVCNGGAANYGIKMHGDSSWASPDNCSASWYYPNENLQFDTYEGDENYAYLTINYTYAELSELEAAPHDGYVVVRWATSYEEHNAGWNIYRALGKNEQYIRLNEFMIEPYRYSYEFIDRDVESGVSYCYKIEAVDLDGTGQWFGPVCATPGTETDAEAGSAESGADDGDADSFSATGGCGG
ncbi:MAG TPA: DNRLRE domain-containing protein [Proteobacteria bacterium]|nr:DNRLRE domain-containing protein [Pseudomonadota bacterium]